MLHTDKTPSIGYDDVLIEPNGFSAAKSRWEAAIYPFMGDGRLPVVSAPMDSIPSTEFILGGKDRMFAIFSHRFQSIDAQVDQLYSGAQASIGMSTSISDIQMLLKVPGLRHILLDTASAGNTNVIQKLKQVKISIEMESPNVKLWAGNVASTATYSALQGFCDYVRVGIGGGGACLTRVNTGVGLGNVTAISGCRALYDRNPNMPLIVADGGIRHNGDIAKALAAGAHLVMMGSRFAKCPESAVGQKAVGNIVTYEGMASKKAAERHGVNTSSKFAAEGGLVHLTLHAPLETFLNEVEGNLRSAMTYVGAKTLRSFFLNSVLRPASSHVADAGHLQRH